MLLLLKASERSGFGAGGGGGGGGSRTVTVADAEAILPSEFWTDSVYSVVRVGNTSRDPCELTVPMPWFNSALTALVLLHLKVDDRPFSMELGSAEILALGAGAAAGGGGGGGGGTGASFLQHAEKSVSERPTTISMILCFARIVTSYPPYSIRFCMAGIQFLLG